MATDGNDVVMVDASTEVTTEKREGSPIEAPKAKRNKPDEEANVETQGLDWYGEYERNKRLQHPWWDETDRPLCEPPDIN